MKIKNIILKTGIIILALVASGFLFRDYISNEYSSLPKKSIQEIPENTKLLVVAPHTDDETLACAGFIKKALGKQGTVRVAIITNGEGAKGGSIRKRFLTHKPTPQEHIALGTIRHRESLYALTGLGVPRKNIVFLGYPDGGTVSMWSENWQAKKPFRDPVTKVNRSPYKFSYSPAAFYSGEYEARDLQNIIRDFKPTIVLYPHPDDHHRDHWATFAFVKYALEQAGLERKPKELVYLVHYDFWPTPFGKHPSGYLTPPRSLVSLEYQWFKMLLTKEEQLVKMRAIKSYKSQIDEMADFLYSFERKNELYAVYDTASLNFKNTKTQINNPKSDYLYGLIRPVGGIVKTQIQNTGKNILINIKLKSKVNPEYTYILDLTLFNKDRQTEKLNVVITKDKVDKLFYSQYWLQNKDIKVRKGRNFILVTVPNPSPAGLHNLLLSTSIQKKSKVIDRTAWKHVYL